MSQLNDISLVAQVVVFHSTRTSGRLVRECQSPVRRFFLHLTYGDSGLSDNLSQDTFIKVYTNPALFKSLSSFFIWLYRITYSVFYNYLRAYKEADGLETRQVDAQRCTQQNDIGQRMNICRALSAPRDMERICITLFYMGDRSIEKITGITGYPAGTVKGHLSQAKDKMVAYLKQNGYDRRR